MALPKFQGGDQALQLMQSAWASVLDPIIKSPTNNARVLSKVSVVAGTNVINHLLGAKLQGWTVTRVRGTSTPSPLISDWTSYPMTIMGATTNPTKGTVAVDKAEWRQVGDSMEVRYQYSQTSAGSAGSGSYSFGLPSGYTMDTSKYPLGGQDASVGIAAAADPSTNYIGYTYSVSSTTFGIVAFAGSTVSVIGSSFVPLSNTSLQYSFNALVPIVGWSAALTSFPQFYDVQDSNPTPDKTLILVASAAAVIDLCVF